VAYRVEFTNAASKELSKLSKRIQPKQLQRIQATIEALSGDPRPPQSESVENTDYLRVRTGDYRIVYLVEEEILTVIIIRIGHRKEVYRKI
jgi:mRNA interferase RelE/StbE